MSNKGIIIQVNGQDKFLSLENIVYIYSHENECDFIRENLAPIKNIRIPLKKVLAMINEQGEFRDHRLFKFSKNTIVNTNFQESIERDGVQKASGPQMMDLEGLYPLKDHRPWMTIRYNNETKTEVIEGTIEGYHKLMQLEKAAPRRFLVRKGGHNVLSMHLTDWYKNEPSDCDIQYVDLGLPSGLKWATSNLVAEKFMDIHTAAPEEAGSYLAFAELQSKDDYSGQNFHATYDDESYFRDYIDYYDFSRKDGNQLPDVLDVVNEHIRSKYHENSLWHIPTKAEWQELCENCDMVWCTSADYTKGILATSKQNGKSIFLPAVGHKEGKAQAINVDTELYYWSSNGDYSGGYASAFYCKETKGESNAYPEMVEHEEFHGLSIRPVLGGKVPSSTSSRKFTMALNKYLIEDEEKKTCSIYRLELEDIIPETVTGNNGCQYTVVAIHEDFYAEGALSFHTLRIPKTLTDIRNWDQLKNWEYIDVDKDNPAYTSIDGVLFDKEMKTLLLYPGKPQEKYIVPEGVRGIKEDAFSRNRDEEYANDLGLEALVLPKSLEVPLDDEIKSCIPHIQHER